MDCYDSALRYSKERSQFGKPIGGFQLTQKKISGDDYRNYKGSIINLPFRSVKNENRATPAQISMAKRNNVNMALKLLVRLVKYMVVWVLQVNIQLCAT